MNDAGLPLLEIVNLSVGYGTPGKGYTSVLRSLNVHLHAGQVVCLLGPNGSGKSTLIRTLAGILNPIAGEVRIANRSIADFSSTERARTISLVLTDKVRPANLRVQEVVELGRTPYTGWFGTLNEADSKKVDWAIELTGMDEYRYRRVDQLSDGEFQKALLARALAQDTPVIILDEPTAHLDLPNRFELMRLLHDLTKKTGKAILLSSHELDLALQAADQLWIVTADGQIVAGVPEDLVLNGTFEASFLKPGFCFDRSNGTFIIERYPNRRTVVLKGDHEGIFWTRRALVREGFDVVSNCDEPTAVHVRVERNRGTGHVWSFSGSPGKDFGSIRAVLEEIRTWMSG